VLNGEVQLDDPISMYLPEGVTAPEYEGRAITLLDLATHTSGLPILPDNIHPRDPSNPYVDYTLEQMYEFLSGYHLTRAPGSIAEYSNYGMGLLGNLLARRTGVADYETLLLARITGPLGMDSTRIELTPDMRSRLATPHSSYSVATSLWDNPTLAGAGAIRSTANDMLTFLAANMGLTETEPQAALHMANTPQHPIDGPDDIGLGWILPYSGNGIHWHNGETGGFHSYLAWDPQHRIGVVVLANAARSIDDIVLQLLHGLPKPFQVNPQVLAAYAGRYQDSEGRILTISVEGMRIFIQAPNQTSYELFARSEDQFCLLVADGEFTFYRNDSGEVERLVVVQFGETWEGEKVP
jgi:CubicO group peptidase (beta-lactamase class C family)